MTIREFAKEKNVPIIGRLTPYKMPWWEKDGNSGFWTWVDESERDILFIIDRSYGSHDMYIQIDGEVI